MPEQAEINALLQSAYAHHIARRYQEAIENYQAALQLAPENFIAHHDLLLAYHDSGQFALAFQELQVATKLLPSDSRINLLKSDLYDQLGGIDNAMVLEESINTLPDDALDRPVLLGLRASQQKDYPQARIDFERALGQQPGTTYIQGYLGRTLLFLRRSTEAREVLTAATRDDQAKPQDLYNLAAIEANLRQYNAAIHELERAVQANKKYYKAWALLATTHARLGHGRSAWRCFCQAVKWHPERQSQYSIISAAF